MPATLEKTKISEVERVDWLMNFATEMAVYLDRLHEQAAVTSPELKELMASVGPPPKPLWPSTYFEN